jgi:hypothetical protein
MWVNRYDIPTKPLINKGFCNVYHNHIRTIYKFQNESKLLLNIVNSAFLQKLKIIKNYIRYILRG